MIEYQRNRLIIEAVDGIDIINKRANAAALSLKVAAWWSALGDFVSAYSFTGRSIKVFIYLRLIDTRYLGNRRSSSLVYCRQAAKQMRWREDFDRFSI